ncbi:MAG: hypothetical protein ACR2JN_06425, partial [Lapillicoccus sp.]
MNTPAGHPRLVAVLNGLRDNPGVCRVLTAHDAGAPVVDVAVSAGARPAPVGMLASARDGAPPPNGPSSQ